MSCRRLMLLGMMISSARGFTQRSLALTRRTRTSPLNLSTRPARPTRLSARDKRAPGDRVFVSGIPKSVDWKDLKDHFRLCGEVAYASVSEGKDHGIVQYETVESAQAAVREMRDHPLHGATLHVREDIQDRDRRRRAGPSLPGYPSPGYPPRQPVTQPVAPPSSREEVDSDLRALTVPALKDLLRAKKLPLAGNTGELVARLLEWRETKENQSRPDDSGPNRPSSSMSARSMSARSSAWRRVDDDESETTPKALELIVGYCEDREKLRQEGDYEKADAIRSALQKKGIKLDDRRRVFWLMDGVPAGIKDENGEGKWEKKPLEWRGLGSPMEVLGAEEFGLVRRLLIDRDAYRLARRWEEADAIYAQLKERHGVVVDDAKKTWFVGDRAD